MKKLSTGEQIIRTLSAKQPEFVSGQELSELLNCSRTAIWKQIRSLEQEGYRFEGVPRRGYRLVETPDRLELTNWESALRTEFIGKPVYYYKQTETTQKVALELAQKGAVEGTMVIAEEQSEGKGRFNRDWHSPQGKGLYFSLILKPVVPLQFMPQFTLLISVAICRAIRNVTKLEPGIKWPNDLMLNDKKIAGILLESNVEDTRLNHVIAGIGVNVNLQRDHLPAELHNTATSLAIEAGTKIDRTSLLKAILEELEAWYMLFQEEGFAPVRMLWEALNITLDRQVEVQSGNQTIKGKAVGIDDDGALIIQTDTERVKCYSGETTLIQ